ncbi:unnamed protein product [Brassicogethes aeneus]|uniref:Pyridine nucleotide-disulfide oxidoreductase domain-containing protein 1 n=1 Tax=Brassicogethes aeneus TaxID=1431903 RepID=A0A9P0FI54_BRAAE|nr:unnamed protein product [Brassicogethes aeneus]
MEATFVVIGGGIAGVTCAESLAFLEPEESIILISESSLIKTVCNLYNITKTLANFDVVEQDSQSLTEKFRNVKVIHDTLLHIDDTNLYVETLSGVQIKYKYLCLCMGATPKLIKDAENIPQILGIRDTDSVERLQEKLEKSKKIAIVGNGGIASELVYKLQDVEVHWIIKDKHISATFVDPGAAEFFQTSLTKTDTEKIVSKRMRYSEEDFRKSGAALGPDWYKNLTIKGGSNTPTKLKVHYQSEIESIQSKNDNLVVKLTTNEEIFCDLVVSATGVNPSTNYTIKNSLKLSNDGGILVNEYMQSNIPNIFAAGDICTTNFPPAKHWFQMKLWTQARQMGCYAAKCMSSHNKNEEILQDFCFEMFSHSTKLFGYKVILLGLYNGQKLGNEYEILLRMTKEREYIKFVLQNHKLQGVVLIGDTDLEETCENLILNQLDLSPYGDDILNPDIDIEDYFD